MSEHLTRTQIKDYNGHKLSAAELISVSHHLGLCDGCSRQVERALGDDAAFFKLKSEVLGEIVYSNEEEPHLTREQLSGFVDDLLMGEELQEIKDHLTGCERCNISVSDLRAFREQIATGINREYHPSSVVTENPWHRFIAALSRLIPSHPVPIFASALAALLLITTGWLVLQAVQRKDTEIGVSPSPSPTPILPPSPRLGDARVEVLAQLNDGGRQVTLDQNGNLSGIDNLSPEHQKMIKDALTNQPLEKSQLLAELGHSNESRVRGGYIRDLELAVIKPVGTVILADRPTFRWSRLAGAESYVIEVYDMALDKVTSSSELTANSWTPSESLTRGKTYTWQVKVIKRGQEFTFPRPPDQEAKFRILDQARADELRRAERVYAGSHLMLGLLYSRVGLLNEAELEFRRLRKANPSSAIVHRLLADVRAMRG